MHKSLYYGCVMAVNARHMINRFHPKYYILRRIMTTPSKMEKALEKLEQNPYYEKYADRIANLQKTSPEEFLKRVERADENQKPKPKLGSVDTRQYSSALNPKEPVKDCGQAGDKKLEDIFKVDLVKDKDAEEIKIIWEEYHKNKEVISATIPSELYTKLHKCSKEHPTFLFPLPRSQGYEFIMAQAHAHTVHFTPLLAFQVHKENAPECLTMVHYTELAHKGLVLMRGEYDKNVLSGKEAQCLANQFQMYYSGGDDARTRMLETFTRSPATFRHMDLVGQLENITLV